jgi:hypothetical protein
MTPADVLKLAPETAPKTTPPLVTILKKIVATGVFDNEEGQAKLFEILEKTLKANHDRAMANIDRLSTDQIRGQLSKTRDRAVRAGNANLVTLLDGMAMAPDSELKDQVRALHSPERDARFLQAIRDSVKTAGSVSAALDTIDDDCWYFEPEQTEITLAIVLSLVEVGWYYPVLWPILLPIVAVMIVYLPIALVIDYVILFPITLFTEIIPCQIDNSGYPTG